MESVCRLTGKAPRNERDTGRNKEAGLPEPVPSLGTSLWNLAFSLKDDGGARGRFYTLGILCTPIITLLITPCSTARERRSTDG